MEERYHDEIGLQEISAFNRPWLQGPGIDQGSAPLSIFKNIACKGLCFRRASTLNFALLQALIKLLNVNMTTTNRVTESNKGKNESKDMKYYEKR
jgi:hypothetical protein